MFEHHAQPPLPLNRFVHRLLRGLGVILGLVAISLLAGTAGYRMTEGMGWIDAFYNASLILSGMGPVNTLKTDAGKIFASLYALYSGLFLIAAAGVLLAPVFHRVLHKFHAGKNKD
ncbi:MAG TPA: hypothetical protein VIF12_07720 [Micavibrio sp.]|jgi:hypothetical protein